MRERLKEMFNKINVENDDVLKEANKIIGTKKNIIKYIDEDLKIVKDFRIDNGDTMLEYNINQFREIIELSCELRYSNDYRDDDIIMLDDSLMGYYKYIVNDNTLCDELTDYIKYLEE